MFGGCSVGDCYSKEREGEVSGMCIVDDVIMTCYCRYERQLDYEREAALRMEEERIQKRKL